MKNRDYFAKPIQAGGRTAHDYGNTHLGYPECGAELKGWHYAAFGAFLAAAMIFGSVA